MNSYRQEFEVGEKLLKAVYYRLVETKCETYRLLKEWDKSCLEDLLQSDEAILPDPNYSDMERAAASDHITLKEMLDSMYKVLQSGASTDLHTAKEFIQRIEEVLKFWVDLLLREIDQDLCYMQLVDTYMVS